MLGIKKIDRYVIRNFLVLFAATFFITTFVIMMQYLWSHIAVMVGKGLSIWVLSQFLFYATLSFLPLALPLAVLMASNMAFGDMGGNLELLALKTAGVSLFRIMRGPFILIILISIGSFFFSNNVIPLAQKRMFILNYSIRQTSPELDIPVGEFYGGIAGMQIYVRSKNHDTGALKHIMIYDFSKGFNNASVTTADTAYVAITADKLNLKLTLINGETFENLKDQGSGALTNVPYRRETFARREVLLDIDANFKELDSSTFDNSFLSKGFARLYNDVDSAELRLDSLKESYATQLTEMKYFNKAYTGGVKSHAKPESQVNVQPRIVQPSEKKYSNLPASKKHKTKPQESALHAYIMPIDPDSVFATLSQKEMENVAVHTHSRINSMSSNVSYHKAVNGDTHYFITRHLMEWYKKLTLPFACLIFFFIGAPLGAITNKGGLGIPVVVSVLMFIVYYVIDNIGQKLAKQELWPVWQGMWLSSFILLPIGIILTYTAATDSVLFNKEAYLKFWDKTLGRFITNLKTKK